MKHWKRSVRAAVTTGLLLCLCGLLVVASCPERAIAQSNNPIPSQTSPPEPPLDPSQTDASPGLQNPQELEAFLDSFLPQEMEGDHTLGGVVSIVKDGEVFFVKGYGFADLERTRPIEGDRTLFRVASLSKLFTDTAVMQLYEQGKLDIHKDVNQYLDSFNIQTPYDQPITAANLMTQTDGTTQRLLGIVAPSASKMEPLEQFIPSHMPPFIFPPGEMYSYSNMGITLAGYLVQCVSQTSFADYIDQNILHPLDMNRSTFHQPVSLDAESHLTPGYRYRNDTLNPYPFLYFNIVPAAALSTTATDMAHFMIAHLQNGRYRDTRILQEETAKLMHERHFTHHPKLPGTAFGFHERLENNLRMIGHSGSMPGYSSSLTLIPEKNVGIFMSFNNRSPSLPGTVLTRLFDRYFPISNPPIPEPSITLNLKEFTGTYRDLEYPRNTLAKLTAPYGHLHVKETENNQLSIETPGLYFPKSITKKLLTPVAPLLFREEDESYSAFAKDAKGKIKFLFNPIGAKIGAFEKVPWYGTIVFQLWFAGICSVIFLSACFINPMSKLLRRSPKPKAPYRFTRYAHWNAALAGSLYSLPLLLSGIYLWLIGVWKLAYGVPLIVNLLLHLLPIAAILSLSLIVWSTLAWKNHYWTWASRLYYSIVTLAALGFIPFLYYWNLLTVRT